jgi:P22_AR N-terminal domain
MRRIVENIGLAWGAQYSKLLEQKEKFACSDIQTHDSSGREQQMLCMPVEKLALWLACINPNKIKSETIRARVELYQAERIRVSRTWGAFGGFESVAANSVCSSFSQYSVTALPLMTRATVAHVPYRSSSCLFLSTCPSEGRVS